MSGDLEGAASQAVVSAAQTAAKAAAVKALIVLSPVLSVIPLIALLGGLIYMAVGAVAGSDSEQAAASVTAAQEAGVPDEAFGAYMEAGREHGVPWEVLAAVAHVETNHGFDAPDGQSRDRDHVAPVVDPAIVVSHGDSTYAGTLLVDTAELDEEAAQSVLESSMFVAEQLAAGLRSDPAWQPGRGLDSVGDVWVRAIDGLPVRGLGESPPVTRPSETGAVHLPAAGPTSQVSADRIYTLALTWYTGQIGAGCGITGADWVTLPTSGPINVGDQLHDSSVLTDEMMGNAQQIVATGRDLDVPDRGLVIAIATAMVESRLVNLDHGDADSLGLFQQRPSQGWGTADQVQDPVYASTTFFERLLALEGWETMPPGDAAQAVQRSAYPDRYALWISDAAGIVASASGAVADADPASAADTGAADGDQGGSGPGAGTQPARSVSAGCNATTTVGSDVSPGPVVADVELAEVSAPGGGTIRVAATIAQPLADMLDAAAAEGVLLNGSGWRDTARQIDLRTINGCPDVWTRPASECRVPTAIPGTSQHEIGLAIDFQCAGASIPRRDSPCFVWLDEHAASYGLFNLPSEPWHWSTTGR